MADVREVGIMECHKNVSFIIDREAGEIIHLVASVCLFVCLFETQINYTLKNIKECSSQGVF